MTDPTPAPPRTSLAKLAARGALWAGFSQYLLFGLGLVKTVLLLRLISVDYFGLFAIAAVWSSYFAFMRFELRVAVMSSQEEPAILNAQFWLESLSALTGVGVAGLVFLVWPGLVPLAGAWPLIFTLMLLGLFEGLTSTPLYLLEKRLRQDVLAKFTVFASLVGALVPIALALSGAPAAAIVTDAILPALITNAGAAVFVRWRPSWKVDGQQLRAQLRLGWTLLSTSLLGKIIFLFDDWLVGNFKRPHPLPWFAAGVEPEGYYSRAYNTGKMPMDVAAGVIGRIALSLYAEGAARGSDVLQKAYQQLTWGLAWIIFGSSALAFVAADDVVQILLGAAWAPMVPLFRLMFLFIVGRPLFQNGAQLLLALRAEKDLHRTVILQAIFIVLACPPAVYGWGAAGAAVVVSLMTVMGLVACEWYVRRRLGVSAWRFYLAPAATCAATIGGLALLAPGLPDTPWLALIIKVVFSSMMFGAALALFERRRLRENLTTLLRGLR
jgi:O-antigen/teichoic acid export membrane protein